MHSIVDHAGPAVRGSVVGRSATPAAPASSLPDAAPANRNGATRSAPAKVVRPAPPFLYQTVTVAVQPDVLPEVIGAFEAVAAQARCERGTRLCAWFQATDEPTRFLQVLVFDDDDAERVHRASPPARRLARLLASGSAHADRPTEWNALAGI